MKMRRFKYVTVVIEYNLHVSHSFTILNLIQSKNDKIFNKGTIIVIRFFFIYYLFIIYNL